MKHTFLPVPHISLFWVTKRLKNNFSVNVFESPQEIQNVTEGKIFSPPESRTARDFFSVAAKMSYFILYGIDKSGTPTYCLSTSCRSFEQIILQTVPLCLMPLILKFEVFTSSKFKGFFFPFLKKKKERNPGAGIYRK